MLLTAANTSTPCALWTVIVHVHVHVHAMYTYSLQQVFSPSLGGILCNPPVFLVIPFSVPGDLQHG